LVNFEPIKLKKMLTIYQGEDRLFFQNVVDETGAALDLTLATIFSVQAFFMCGPRLVDRYFLDRPTNPDERVPAGYYLMRAQTVNNRLELPITRTQSALWPVGTYDLIVQITRQTTLAPELQAAGITTKYVYPQVLQVRQSQTYPLAPSGNIP
jgi:hypothetical protein